MIDSWFNGVPTEETPEVVEVALDGTAGTVGLWIEVVEEVIPDVNAPSTEASTGSFPEAGMTDSNFCFKASNDASDLMKTYTLDQFQIKIKPLTIDKSFFLL